MAETETATATERHGKIRPMLPHVLESAMADPVPFVSALGFIAIPVFAGYGALECGRWLARHERSWRWWLMLACFSAAALVAAPTIVLVALCAVPGFFG